MRAQPNWQPDQQVVAMIYAIAEKHARRRADWEDFVQEGILAAWECEQTFDPDFGASLATYSRRPVKQAIMKASIEEYNLSGVRVPRRSMHRVVAFRDGWSDGIDPDDVQRAEWAMAKPASVTEDVLGPDEDGVIRDEQLTVHRQAIPAELIQQDHFTEEIEEALEIDAALARLGAEERGLIELYYFDGLSDSQIAERLGTHRTTITRNRERAEQLLRASLREGESE